jgi:hypothetical protein
MKLPNILKFGQLFNPTLDNTVKKIININEIYELLVCELVFIGFVITFGTIFPPLAVVLSMAISAKIYFHQILLGRFISNVLSFNNYSRFDMLEDNLKVVPSLSTIENCGWFLLYTACCFYSIFLFDILGDSVGFYEAYWILIVMPCIPLCIQVLIKCHAWAMGSRMITYNRNQSTEAIQLSSLSPRQEIASNPMYGIESDIDRSIPILDIDVSIILDKSPYCIS